MYVQGATVSADSHNFGGSTNFLARHLLAWTRGEIPTGRFYDKNQPTGPIQQAQYS